MIEEPIPVRGAEAALRTDGRRYVRAYMAPGREPLDIAVKDGYAVVRVPDFDGYRMVVFEEEGADSGLPPSGRSRTKERT